MHTEHLLLFIQTVEEMAHLDMVLSVAQKVKKNQN